MSWVRAILISRKTEVATSLGSSERKSLDYRGFFVFLDIPINVTTKADAWGRAIVNDIRTYFLEHPEVEIPLFAGDTEYGRYCNVTDVKPFLRKIARFSRSLFQKNADQELHDHFARGTRKNKVVKFASSASCYSSPNEILKTERRETHRFKSLTNFLDVVM